MTTDEHFHIYPCGDHAITLELGNRIDVTLHRKVMAVYQYLLQKKIAGVLDIIPGYSSVTLVYDLPRLLKQYPGRPPYENMRMLMEEAAAIDSTGTVVSAPVRIPVCYDTELGPDIVSLAILHDLRVEEVIALHTARTYHVYMIGFLPGFAYMGLVDAQLITPRKAQPRTQVPAGSIGIAGEQTGIYPFDSPGGWQLIGCTPLRIFDIAKQDPCYLKPGDEVQFYPISFAEFEKMKTL